MSNENRHVVCGTVEYAETSTSFTTVVLHLILYKLLSILILLTSLLLSSAMHPPPSIGLLP